MNRVFIGFDHRQFVAYTVLHASLLRHAKAPLAITPLVINQLPLKRTGLTPFTWTRFLVPSLCNFDGYAVFMDADMLAQADIGDLLAIARNDPTKAVWVVKNQLKYEWASMMVFNCGHPDNTWLAMPGLETANGLHQIRWTEAVGELPAEWNHLVGYDAPIENPKLLHYTQGIPVWPETAGGGYKDEWDREARAAGSARPWLELMGNSVHFETVMRRNGAETKVAAHA